MINVREIPNPAQVLTANVTGLLFRLGLGGLFFINAIVALLRPEDFIGLIDKSGLTNAMSYVGGIRFITVVIAANDALLGSLLISGKCRRFTNLWIGLYLLVVTAIKLLALV